MKSHNMAIFMLLFFCSSISAMEQQPKQVPATAVAISKPVNIAEITTIMQAIDLDDPVILPADLPPLPSIYLVSKQDRSGYAINSHAIPYSGFLTSFIDFQTAQELQQDSTKKKNRIKHIVINLSGKQLSAMVQLLQFLYNHRLEILSYEEIQNY